MRHLGIKRGFPVLKSLSKNFQKSKVYSNIDKEQNENPDDIPKRPPTKAAMSLRGNLGS